MKTLISIKKNRNSPPSLFEDSGVLKQIKRTKITPKKPLESHVKTEVPPTLSSRFFSRRYKSYIENSKEWHTSKG